MTSTFAVLRTQLSNFFVWWGGELAGMLPTWMAEGGAQAGPAFIICVDKDGLRLLTENLPGAARKADTSGPAPERPALTAAMIATKLSRTHRVKLPVTVGLRIPLDYCFNRLVELPAAAAKDFSRLLVLDMERATPFRGNEVYTAFVAEPQGASRPGKTAIRQFIVKRSRLAGAIAEIENAGLRIGRMDCWDGAGRAPLKIDFRGSEAGAVRRGRSLTAQIAAASTVAAILAGVGAYTTLANLNSTLSSLEAQAKELRARAASQRASQENKRTAQSTLAALDALVTSPPTKLAVIDELTQVLPDSAWLNDVRVTTEGVDINGFATSTVALLPLLEKSPRFMDATSSAAVTFDPREDKERFSIHVRYRPNAAAPAQMSVSQQ